MKKIRGVFFLVLTILCGSMMPAIHANQINEPIVLDGVPENGYYFEEKTSGTGTGWANTTTSGYFLVGDLGRNMSGANTGFAKWMTEVPAGTYKVEYVQVRMTLSHEVVVCHDGKEETKTVPGGGSNSVWIDLGEFYFSGDGQEYVKAQRTAAGTGANFRVDAVRLTRMDSQDAKLELSGLEVESGLLMEQFDPAQLTYDISFPATASMPASYRVKPQTTMVAAQIYINGTQVNSGEWSQDISTQNVCEIVIKKGQESETYVLTPNYILDTEYGEPYYMEQNGSTPGSTWKESGLLDFWGKSKTRYAAGDSSGVAAYYRPALPEKDYYTVAVWKTAATGNSPNGIYEIKHNGGMSTATVSFSTGQAGWQELGTYYFSGIPGEEVLLNATESGIYPVRADAVRFRKAEKKDDHPPVWKEPSIVTKAAGQSTLFLKWTAAWDDIGVAGYEIYIDGMSIGTTTATEYIVQELQADMDYQIEIEVFDEAGNRTRSPVHQARTAASWIKTQVISEAAQITGEDLSVSFTIFSACSNTQKMSAYAALYIGDRMMDIKGTPLGLEKEGEYETKQLSFSLTDGLRPERIQIYVLTVPELQPAGKMKKLYSLEDAYCTAINVADFGAIGDGINDDGPALERAFTQLNQAGTGILEFEEHKNYLVGEKSENWNRFCLNGLRNVRIEGKGSTLIFSRSNVPFILKECENLTLRQLNIDYEEPTFFQGQVIGKDIAGKYIEVKLEAGYPAPPVGTGIAGGGGRHGMIFEGVTGNRRIIANELDHFKVQQIEAIGEDLYRFTFLDQYVNQIAAVMVGDTITHGFGTLHYFQEEAGKRAGIPSGAVLVTKSSQVHFEQINLYAALVMGFRIFDNDGPITFNQVNLVRKPGTTRMLSIPSDGIHGKNNRGGLIIENSIIEACGDDLISISTKDEKILSQKAPDAYELVTTDDSYYCYSVRPGDILQFINRTTGERYGQATVVTSKENVAKRSHLVTLDSGIEGMESEIALNHVFVQNLSAVSAQSKITGNQLRPVFRHAVLYRGIGAELSNNDINCEKGGFVGINLMDEGTTGPFSQSILIQGNRITNTYGWGIRLGTTLNNSAGAQVEQNLLLSSNRITPKAGIGILFTNANQCSLQDDSIDMNQAQDSGSAIVLQNALGIQFGNTIISDRRSTADCAIQLRGTPLAQIDYHSVQFDLAPETAEVSVEN